MECGKIQYLKKTALTLKNSRLGKGENFLRVYHCPSCNFYHLTHKNKGGARLPKVKIIKRKKKYVEEME